MAVMRKLLGSRPWPILEAYILTVCFLQDTVSLAATFYANQKRLVPLALRQESS